MNYYNPETKEIKSYGELVSLYENSSIPYNYPKVFDWYLVKQDKKPEVDNQHKVVRGEIELVDDQYVQRYVVEEKSEEELNAEREILFSQLRDERDRRLSQYDYMFLTDTSNENLYSPKVEKIKEYRQALRDLPSQPGAPWDGGGSETPWPEIQE